jgi:hypothetical protein
MYVIDEVSLSVIPLLNALALMVVVAPTEMELEYAVDEADGSEPSTVYLIVAPEVGQLSATLWDEE